MSNKKKHSGPNKAQHAVEQISKLLDDLDPENNAVALKMFNDLYYDEFKDIVLAQHVDDIDCDEDCSTCSEVERQDCLVEMKQLLYYLGGKAEIMDRRMEELTNQMNQVMLQLKQTETKEAETQLKRLKEGGHII
ncbi:MAG: hypothetical protein RBG13Loki_2483 [Promethearchaeota archaeon CR_4]|nr:MAG: hypothetical protein RBG13Loki_2483 [Candidatus Lokiarchaeota archaeon CR_4]